MARISASEFEERLKREADSCGRIVMEINSPEYTRAYREARKRGTNVAGYLGGLGLTRISLKALDKEEPLDARAAAGDSGMTLRKALAGAGERDVFYIGGVKGNSFAFIGTKGEFARALGLINARLNARRDGKPEKIETLKVAKAYRRTVFGEGTVLLLEGCTVPGKYWCRDEEEADAAMAPFLNASAEGGRP